CRHREPSEDRSENGSSTKSGQEGPACQRKKQAVRVDGGEDECSREEREKEHAVRRHRLAYQALRDSEDGSGSEPSRGHGDQDSGDHRRSKYFRNTPHHQWVEREERGALFHVV